MDSSSLLQFVVGLVVLLVGAELLVRGASRLAAVLGIAPLLIGLTVVAFGTSAPELAVTVAAGRAGQDGLVMGNVVGSNIFNILFILGLSAVIAPLVVSARLVRIDVPLMVVASLALIFFARDGQLTRMEGLILFAGIVADMLFVLRQYRKESPDVQAEFAQEYGANTGATLPQLVLQAAMIVVGLEALILGSRWMVDGATRIAQGLGVSELIIGLTIVAVGTGAPELATSLIAALRGERDIAVGNVIGSNLFNILFVLGITALVMPRPLEVAPSVLRFDLPFMLAVSIACLPIFLTGYNIARWEGLLFLGYYVAYTLYLLLDATQHDALPRFSAVMLEFVVPLTVITLIVSVVRSVRAGRRTEQA